MEDTRTHVRDLLRQIRERLNEPAEVIRLSHLIEARMGDEPAMAMMCGERPDISWDGDRMVVR